MKRINLLTALCFLCLSSIGQIFADLLLDSGPCENVVPILCPAGVSTPAASIDNNSANYALLHSELGITPLAYLEIAFSRPAPAGSVMNIVLSEQNQILSAEALQSFSITYLTYDDSVVYEQNGLSLQDVYALSGEGDIFVYSSRSPNGNYAISKLRVTWGGLVNVFGSLAVHGAFYIPPNPSFANPLCYPLLADALISFDNTLNPQRIVDTDLNSFGLFTLPVGILTDANVVVELDRAEPGDFVAFEVGPNNVVLGTGLIGNLSLILRDDQGNIVAEKSDFELADLIAVSEIGPSFWLGIKSPAGNYNLHSAELRMAPTVGVLYDLRVYGAIALSFGDRIRIQANKQSICEDEKITLTAADGYTNYSWSTGATGKSIQVSEPGLYVVYAESNIGCMFSGLFFLKDGKFTIEDSLVSPACAQGNGEVHLSAIPEGSFSFIWQDGFEGASRSNLPAGFHNVQVISDSTGCSQNIDILLENPDGPFITFDLIQPDCGQSNGTIFSNAFGDGPFTYLWSDGSTSASITGKPAGKYILMVSDQAGCTSVETIWLADNENFNLSSIKNLPDCGQQNGSIIINIPNSDNYSFSWSNGQTTKDAINLGPGTYNLIVTDNSGPCSASYTFTLSGAQVTNPFLQDLRNASCNGSDGMISLDPVDDYIIQWNHGDTLWTIDSLTPGIYQALVVNTVNNCRGYFSYEIKEHQLPRLDISVKDNCLGSDGAPNGRIIISPDGDPEELEIVWSNGQEGKILNDLSAGLYTATLTDSSGCEMQFDLKVEDEDCENPCNLEFYNQLSPNNDGLNDTWEIRNLEFCPDNSLVIFDRWGTEVYRSGPYNNDWDGTSPSRTEILPIGTYFYVFKTATVKEAFTGMINLVY